MCILFVHTNPNPGIGTYRLILASNRDEYYVRNAQEARILSENPTIISGLDMEPGREGGTWLGLSSFNTDKSENGTIRVGALLNLTGEPRHPGAAGRGFIVTDYLKNTHIPTDKYISSLSEKKYNAFNFVAIEMSKDSVNTFHCTNVGSEVLSFESNATLGFGNSLPNKALSKVKAGRIRFNEIISRYNNVTESEKLVDELLNLLKWDQRHLPDEELQRRAPDAYQYLSSVYVHIPIAEYGTRTHTIVLVDWNGEVQYMEDTMVSPIDIQKPNWNKQCIKAHL